MLASTLGAMSLSIRQYDIVYNSLSFAVAAMGAAFIFFILIRPRIGVDHRIAVTLSTVVVAIAFYHYLRIFDSWGSAYTYQPGSGRYVAGPDRFNEGYRYVDWLLTVPLLLAELVLVLKLATSATRSLLWRLIPAAVLMIALGYPGEVAPPDSVARTVWGVLSTLPFLYILYVLFVELGKSMGRQPDGVAKTVNGLRYLLLFSWGVYPLAYIVPSVISIESRAEWIRQFGYSFADVLAKPVFGLLIVWIAVLKTRADQSQVESMT
jgi:bacteriorhodopsin